MYQTFLQEIQNFQPKTNAPLAPFTTWKIGGPADILVELNDSQKLLSLILLAQKYQIPYRILGGGSNVLISDQGLRGLVIINKSRNIDILSSSSELSVSEDEANQFNPWIQPRHGEADEEFYSFKDLDYTEQGERVLVKFDSGVDMAWAIAWTLKNSITGLQFFAGIPGTIGGALFNNIHGGTKHFSDNFASATVIEDGVVKTYTYEDFNFGYDQSVLREKQDLVIVDVTLNLYYGDVEKARFVANEWTKRKRRQPRQTAGCTFKNIPLDKQAELGFPTPSVGYIVDKLFGWTNKGYGDIVISPLHHNFIENKGQGRAEDVLRLINEIRDEAKKRYNLDLETEINLLGFDKSI